MLLNHPSVAHNGVAGLRAPPRHATPQHHKDVTSGPLGPRPLGWTTEGSTSVGNNLPVAVRETEGLFDCASETPGRLCHLSRTHTVK